MLSAPAQDQLLPRSLGLCKSDQPVGCPREAERAIASCLSASPLLLGAGAMLCLPEVPAAALLSNLQPGSAAAAVT